MLTSKRHLLIASTVLACLAVACRNGGAGSSKLAPECNKQHAAFGVGIVNREELNTLIEQSRVPGVKLPDTETVPFFGAGLMEDGRPGIVIDLSADDLEREGVGLLYSLRSDPLCSVPVDTGPTFVTRTGIKVYRVDVSAGVTYAALLRVSDAVVIELTVGWVPRHGPDSVAAQQTVVQNWIDRVTAAYDTQ